MADGKQAREARLAAALRENLKRRKAAASPAGDTGVAAGPGAPPAGRADTADAADGRETDGGAEHPPAKG